MELNYITQLGEQDFVELINFCIERQNKKYQKDGFPSHISSIGEVSIHGEIDRRDFEGNRYFWVCTFDGARVFDSYIVRDFNMEIASIGSYGRHVLVDYTTDMREFMAKRFGKEYIKSLYQYQVSEAEKEMKRLMGCLPKEKKI